MEKTSNGTGHYVNVSILGEEVQAFVPSALQPASELWLDTEVFHRFANAQYGLCLLSERLVDAPYFPAMQSAEAWFSARIEGYESDFEAYLLGRYYPQYRTSAAVAHACHIRDAMTDLTDVCKIHACVLPGGGELRKVPCWVGGYSPARAVYVPPPASEVPALLASLDRFVCRENLPNLLKAGIVHAQFENIHPFYDGNGRTGRVLIHSILSPSYNISGLIPLSRMFYESRAAYYSALNSVRVEGSYVTWLRYYLRCMEDACRCMEDVFDVFDSLWDTLRAAGLDSSRAACQAMDRGLLLAKEDDQACLDRGVAAGLFEPRTAPDGALYYVCPKALNAMSGKSAV